MSQAKTHVKKGDQVQVIAGNHKGKTGVVLSVNATKSQVVVDGVRPLKKAVRRSEKHPDGGIITIDGPLHISKVKKLG
jgi:large subunit ribosomal protein L24